MRSKHFKGSTQPQTPHQENDKVGLDVSEVPCMSLQPFYKPKSTV